MKIYVHINQCWNLMFVWFFSRRSYISPSAPNVAHGIGEMDEEEQAMLGSIFEYQGGSDYGFRLKI